MLITEVSSVCEQRIILCYLPLHPPPVLSKCLYGTSGRRAKPTGPEVQETRSKCNTRERPLCGGCRRIQPELFSPKFKRVSTAVEERFLNSVPTIIQPVLPLTSTSSLNPDSSRFEFTTIRNTNKKEIAYHYWVYEGLGNPTALFFYEHQPLKLK